MKRISISDIGIMALLSFFVVGVMLVSFVSKSLNYAQTNDSVKLVVQKKEFSVYAQTNGILVNSAIRVGQHVKKGDMIGQLSNETLDKQISVLSELAADNASASIQLFQLQTEKASQTLYSPTDGVVASAAAQGEAINNVQKVATIYSDDAVQLLGRFSYSNYNLFQQNTADLTATSLRDNQQYAIDYGGTLQEISSDQNKQSYVTLFFTFTSPNDAVNVLQKEEMTMKVVRNNGSLKPIDALRKAFDESIFSNSN